MGERFSRLSMEHEMTGVFAGLQPRALKKWQITFLVVCSIDGVAGRSQEQNLTFKSVAVGNEIQLLEQFRVIDIGRNRVNQCLSAHPNP